MFYLYASLYIENVATNVHVNVFVVHSHSNCKSQQLKLPVLIIDVFCVNCAHQYSRIYLIDP